MNKNQTTDQPKKDLFRTMTEHDFRWKMKNTGDLVPIERLPDQHWETVLNKYKGEKLYKNLCIQYRQALLSLGIKRDKISGPNGRG